MLEELLNKYGVRADVNWSANNPQMTGMQNANHYKVVFHITDEDGTRQMTVPYSKGSALKDAPTTTEVIDCLISDMNCIADGLDEFVDSMGYDYKEGKRIFDNIETQTQKMFNFFGFDKFREIKELYESEEL